MATAAITDDRDDLELALTHRRVMGANGQLLSWEPDPDGGWTAHASCEARPDIPTQHAEGATRALAIHYAQARLKSAMRAPTPES